jgi:hypothetical protein
MNKILTIAALALAIAACQSKKPETEATADTTAVDTVAAPAPSTATTLTDAQKAEGWKLLFDGVSTTGWKFYKDQPNDTWEVVDGTLHCKANVEGKEAKRSDIMTTEQFENFELAFDWKISPGGNSGVMFHVTEEFDRPYLTGPEYQVIDDKGYDGKLKDSQLTGSNYDMHPAQNARPNPIGEWNQSRIVVNGNHVEHWLNGTKVVEYELGSADWKKRKAVSKWKDAAKYGIEKKGAIDIQDHDHEAWYKNIMIKTL